jgi:preprotein translocase subunit SecG
MNLSALVVMSIIVGVVAIIVGVFLQKKHEEDFENTLQQLSAFGKSNSLSEQANGNDHLFRWPWSSPLVASF